ncbi:hypothetical protein SEA_GILGAMESH_106 [Streptomyces phage Gilgamesh]|uniref:Uncharacterized protein n=1 Tax=Streptomyces phage Gilgamesh TaxID=2599890 RepID=A0A5J6TSE7_9CAUD|nr:hypothetical protein QEH35_gp106 [Streptomyces phage Gilgamesh]QFG13298.1 hypothetical protein SEA_GILGAMESH_106 [Streptomyces phage Gilgamesh]
MSAPVIIREDLQQLLASPGEDPVLYLKAGPDDEGGPLEVDVWVSAYVHHSKVIVHRHEVVDALGDAPDDDALDDYLPLLEQTVEEVAAALA